MVRAKRREQTPDEQAFDMELGLAVAEKEQSGVRVVGDNVVLHDDGTPITRMKLAQATSAEGAPGSFYSTDTLEEYEDLHLVPIRVQAIRTFWPAEGFSRVTPSEANRVSMETTRSPFLEPLLGDLEGKVSGGKVISTRPAFRFQIQSVPWVRDPAREPRWRICPSTSPSRIARCVSRNRVIL